MTPAPPLALDGGWEIRGFLGDTWQWFTGRDRPRDEPHWFPARVPGAVLDDLHRAGQVPDPYSGLGSLAVEWVPERTWLYRRRVRLDRALEGGERALLRFAGVDPAATVLVDGAVAARHEGMYRPFEVDVTDALRDGRDHLIAVAVHPAPRGEPQVGRTDRVREHRPRMGYGWDFCPRVVHQGIWRPVTLEVAGTLRLAGAVVAAEAGRGSEPGPGLVRARVRVEGGRPGTLRLRVRGPGGDPGSGSGPVVAGTEVRWEPGDRGAEAGGTESPVAPGGEALLEASVPRPELWWPRGDGGQPLYEAEVTLQDDTARTVGEHRASVGFRRVRLVPNEGAPDDALPYTFEVNGRRIYARGWNWVPLDALHGVPRPERLEHLLRLAADADVNLLRVWGGGLVETPEFYGLCDRLGLMVWQEFGMSSSGMDSVPAADAEFVALMAAEARAVVPARRHHPALVLWSAGNELHDTSTATPLDDTAPVIGALRAAVGELAPDRAWLPTSPSGRGFLHRADVIAADPGGQHDVHGPWEHQGLAAHNALYDAGTNLLHSEFGVEGMANRRTWEAVVPEDARWPTGRDNPVLEHLGAWWNNTGLVRAAFGDGDGDGLRDADAVRRASRQLQYDGLRYAVEAAMRRAPRNSGALPWQFNESYPNAWCTAAVDHRGDAKGGYFGVRRAYRPRHVCARFATQAWGGHERVRAEVFTWARSGAGAGWTVTARFLDLYGKPLAEKCWEVAGAGRPGPVGELEMPVAAVDGDLFLLDLTLRGPDGEPLAGNRYVHARTGTLAPLLGLPVATVTAETAPDLTALRLRHTGGPAALGLWLSDGRPYEAPGWAAFDANMFDLLPGEELRVAADWRSAPPEGRTVHLEGWNIRATELS